MASLQPVSFTNSDYSAEQAEIDRRRKMAELMQAQGMTPMGQTEYAPGGFAIRKSPLEGLAKVAQAFAGSYGQQRSKEQQEELSRRAQADAMKWYGEQPQARPMSAPGFGGEPEQPTGGTQQPTQQERMAWLMRGQGNPYSSPIAGAMLAQQMKGPNDMLAKINPKDYTPESFQAFMQSQNPALLRPVQDYATVGGNLVPKPQGALPPGGIQPVYTAPAAPVAPPASIKEYEYAKGQGFKGTFEEFELARKRAGAANVRVTATAGTENQYGKQFAGQIAQADSSMRDAAIKAPDLAERSNNIRKILASGNAITGTGAEFRLQFAKAAQLAGLGDGSASATEQVATSLAQNTLDAIKASGLGSGTGFSNADRDFLEKAVGGKITLERQTLERLAELSHRAAAKSAERWNTRVKEIPRSALEGTGIKTDPIAVPNLFKTPMQAPQAGKPVVVDW